MSTNVGLKRFHWTRRRKPSFSNEGGVRRSASERGATRTSERFSTMPRSALCLGVRSACARRSSGGMLVPCLRDRSIPGSSGSFAKRRVLVKTASRSPQGASGRFQPQGSADLKRIPEDRRRMARALDRWFFGLGGRPKFKSKSRGQPSIEGKANTSGIVWKSSSQTVGAQDEGVRRPPGCVAHASVC